MTDPTRTSGLGKFAALSICAILLILFASTAWLASLGKCGTTDEPGHLLAAWVQKFYGDFRFDCENPPLWKDYVAAGMGKDDLKVDPYSNEWNLLLKSSTPLGPLASDALYRTAGIDADSVLHPARARMLALGILLGMLVGWWAWRIAGRVAGVVAMAAFCFDPNFLAHSPLVKNDVPLALALLCFMAALWLFGERATFLRWVFVTVALSAAILVKFSGLIAIPVLFIVLLARSLIGQPWIVGRWTVSARRHRLLCSLIIVLWTLLLAWVFTWACYDFSFTASKDPSVQFDFQEAVRLCARHQVIAESPDSFQITPKEFDEFLRHWRQPVAVRMILFANAHELLPQTCLIGMLRLYGQSISRVAYLCGQSSIAGWWYYFPLAMAFKTPLATLLGCAAAIVLLVGRIRKNSAWNWWPIIAVVILPCFYMLTAMTSNVDVGIRHILPVYPFIFILLGVAAAKAWNSRRRHARLIIMLLTVGLAAESVAAYPNFIPFFNIACGGPRGGLRLLSESNIDWGQDLPALAQWQARNPNRPIYLLYWGSADPRYYGIRYVNLPQSDAPPDQTASTPGRPVFAISAVVLTNPLNRQFDQAIFASIQHQQPIAVLNGSIYLYDAPG